MPSCWFMLGADDSFGQLAYIIGALLLAGLSALAEKLKKKREESSDHRPGAEDKEPDPTLGREILDPQRGREVRTPSGEPRPSGPMAPAPQRRSPMSEASPVPQRRPSSTGTPPSPPQRPSQPPIPARRPAKARPAQVKEPTTPARPEKLGEYVASRQVGGEVGQLGKAMPAPSAGRQMIAKMGSESIVTAVGTSSPKMPIAALPVATVVGPIAKISVADLRRAFVMSEILQPPIALRE